MQNIYVMSANTSVFMYLTTCGNYQHNSEQRIFTNIIIFIINRRNKNQTIV